MKLFCFGSFCRWTAIVLVLTTLGKASEPPTLIVSPSSAKGAEGDLSIRPARDPNRLQFLFPATDFAGLPESQRWLTGYNYRLDRTQTQDVDWIFNDVEYWISTTTADSSTLSTNFASNHGPDKTLVHSGTYIYHLLGGSSTTGPRDFAPAMKFQTPFYYDPSKGNLLIEQVYRSNITNSPTIDVVSTTGFAVVSGGFDINASSGTRLRNLPSAQFEFVPEPSSGLMASIGAACLAAFWRRRAAR